MIFRIIDIRYCIDFYWCITVYYKFSGLEQDPISRSHFCRWVEVRSLGQMQLGSSLRIYKAKIKMLAGQCYHLEV